MPDPACLYWSTTLYQLYTLIHVLVYITIFSGGSYGTYHAIPPRIAINMIMCCAAGGVLSIVIACWAQLRYETDSINANEISNGILSCLVAITASCPFVSYWAACMIGSELTNTYMVVYLKSL